MNLTSKKLTNETSQQANLFFPSYQKIEYEYPYHLKEYQKGPDIFYEKFVAMYSAKKALVTGNFSRHYSMLMTFVNYTIKRTNILGKNPKSNSNSRDCNQYDFIEKKIEAFLSIMEDVFPSYNMMNSKRSFGLRNSYIKHIFTVSATFTRLYRLILKEVMMDTIGEQILNNEYRVLLHNFGQNHPGLLPQLTELGSSFYRNADILPVTLPTVLITANKTDKPSKNYLHHLHFAIRKLKDIMFRIWTFFILLNYDANSDSFFITNVHYFDMESLLEKFVLIDGQEKGHALIQKLRSVALEIDSFSDFMTMILYIQFNNQERYRMHSFSKSIRMVKNNDEDFFSLLYIFISIYANQFIKKEKLESILEFVDELAEKRVFALDLKQMESIVGFEQTLVQVVSLVQPFRDQGCGQ